MVPAIFSFLVCTTPAANVFRVYSAVLTACNFWCNRTFVNAMYSCKTFDLVRLRSSDLAINDAFYTDCFEENGVMKQVYEIFSKELTAEAKFLYVNGLLRVNNKLPVNNNMTNTKNDNEARQLRQQANVHFQSQDYVKAMRDYNASVMVAVVGSEDYALAVANRSAALFKLEKYDASIGDIRHALANNYPSELAYKLYDREVKCLLKLKKTTQANLKHEVFLCHLAQTSLTEDRKKKIIFDLKQVIMKSNLDAIPSDVNEDNETCVISLLGGPNKNIPALSRFVNIRYTESMGRSLVVSTDVHPGDVLAIEKSYTGVLDYESFKVNCRNCFKHCLNGIPCLKCSWVIYCDETCRSKSYDSGHKYECLVLNGFLHMPSITNLHYLAFYIVLTSIVKLGLNKYIDIVHALNANSDPLMSGFNANGQYLSEEFNAVYALEGNETKRNNKYLFMRYCYAAVIVSYLALAGIEIPYHQLGKVGESVVHILCVVTSNAHGTSQPLECITWVPTLVSKMACAHMLMPLLSLVNHSCDPNVVRQEFGGTLVLRAIQPIKKGSEIFDSYGFLYAMQTKEVRRTKLLSQYCFSCQCTPCKENWPLFIKLSNSDDIYKSTYLERVKEKLTNVIEKLKCKEEDGIIYIKFLNSHLEFLHNNVKKPCFQYCVVQETIKEIYARSTSKHIIFEDVKPVET